MGRAASAMGVHGAFELSFVHYEVSGIFLPESMMFWVCNATQFSSRLCIPL